MMEEEEEEMEKGQEKEEVERGKEKEKNGTAGKGRGECCCA